jgi:hypothetical protein
MSAVASMIWCSTSAGVSHCVSRASRSPTELPFSSDMKSSSDQPGFIGVVSHNGSVPGDVHNEISGGPFFGPVVQAGTIGSTTFSASTASVPVKVAVRDPRPVFASALANGFSGRDWLIGRIDEFLA